jgi:FtsZ-binding cell division protein ZapB
MDKVKQLQIEREELKERLAKSDAINSQFRKEIDALADENERLKKEMAASYEIIEGAKKSVRAAREKVKNAKECSKRIKRKNEMLIKKQGK